MHKRAVIREYVKNLLLNETASGSNVFTKRVDNAFSDEIPCIIVKARSDKVLELFGEEPPTYQRTLSLQINIVTLGDEDAANDLADVVEALVLKDFTLGGNARRSMLVETNLDPDKNGSEIYWDASIVIDVDYISIFS